MKRRTFMLATAAGASSLAFPSFAQTAANYPSKPIRLIVGFAAGGATDIVARIVATHLQAELKQSVIVENKPGGGSNIGADQVVRAAPDGYTLLMATIANATNMSIYKNLAYDTQRDLVPVSMIMSAPSVLVVTPSLPVHNLKELIALAKAKPGELAFASSGAGGSPHLAGEMLKLRAGIDMLHVPYKGAAPALNDVVAGFVPVGFKTAMSAIPHIKAGKLRAIAVASSHRLELLPDVPTMAEAGMPDFEVSSWNGVMAPTGTPQAIIDKLAAECSKIAKLPEVQKTFAAQAATAVGNSPEEFKKFIDAEIKKWAEVAKAANISL